MHYISALPAWPKSKRNSKFWRAENLLKICGHYQNGQPRYRIKCSHPGCDQDYLYPKALSEGRRYCSRCCLKIYKGLYILEPELAKHKQRISKISKNAQQETEFYLTCSKQKCSRLYKYDFDNPNVFAWCDTCSSRTTTIMGYETTCPITIKYQDRVVDVRTSKVGIKTLLFACEKNGCPKTIWKTNFVKGQRLCHGCGKRGDQMLRLYNKMMLQAKNRGRQKRGIEISLSFADFKRFKEKNNNCFYCGKMLMHPLKIIRAVHLDRVDNGKGYHLDNIVSCCGLCNRTKGSALTKNEMLVVAALRKLPPEALDEGVHNIKKMCETWQSLKSLDT